jgi:hypothetical protein
LGKKFYNSLKIALNFFLQHFKTKIIFNFVKFVATKKDMTTNFYSPLSFVAFFGSLVKLNRKKRVGYRTNGAGTLSFNSRS